MAAQNQKPDLGSLPEWIRDAFRGVFGPLPDHSIDDNAPWSRDDNAPWSRDDDWFLIKQSVPEFDVWLRFSGPKPSAAEYAPSASLFLNSATPGPRTFASEFAKTECCILANYLAGNSTNSKRIGKATVPSSKAYNWHSRMSLKPDSKSTTAQTMFSGTSKMTPDTMK